MSSDLEFDLDLRLMRLVDDQVSESNPFDPLNESKVRGRPEKGKKKNVVIECKEFLHLALQRIEVLKCRSKT